MDVDALATTAAAEEYLTGSRKTAFPLLQYTERTDRFVTALLAGRVGILIDGLPLAYLAPVNLGRFFFARAARIARPRGRSCTAR